MRHLLLALLCAALLPAAAHADTIVQNATTGDFIDSAGGTEFPTFSEFNASLGTLDSVSATITGNFDDDGAAGFPVSLTFELYATLSDVFVDDDDTIHGTGPNALSASGSSSNGTTLADLTGTGDTSLYFVYRGNGSDITTASSTGFNVALTYTYTPAAAPEPAPLVLLGTGMFGVLGLRRRRFERIS